MGGDMFEGIEFKDYVAGHALEVLMELFVSRPAYLGGEARIAQEAQRIADEMDKQKTDNTLINFLAVRSMKGILIGNYHNYYKELRMPGTGVHIVPFVQKCFKIAGMMTEKNSPTTEPS
jgi:hypothetical protein